jgi:formylglycine-generating enzyme required for sulfatase activity
MKKLIVLAFVIFLGGCATGSVGGGKLPEAGSDSVVDTGSKSMNVAPPEKKDSAAPVEERMMDYFTNSIGMKFVKIPAGKFLMGSPRSEAGRGRDEGPQFQVTITKPFYLGVYEVTQGQYKEIVGGNPSYFGKCGGNCPVENLTWDDIQTFIQKLNAEENTTKYRLPTEAEWEYACRAGTQTAFSFGNNENDLNEYGWYWKNADDKTHPVGEKKPNAWGLYDMHGNVEEWLQDWYGEYTEYPKTDPKGAAKRGEKVFRGGSWFRNPKVARCAHRASDETDNWSLKVGFRLLRELE